MFCEQRPRAGSNHCYNSVEAGEALFRLEHEFLGRDCDLDGFITPSDFIDTFRDLDSHYNLIKLTEEDQNNLLKSVTTSPQGIDYYNFLRNIRSIAAKLDHKDLTQTLLHVATNLHLDCSLDNGNDEESAHEDDDDDDDQDPLQILSPMKSLRSTRSIIGSMRGGSLFGRLGSCGSHSRSISLVSVRQQQQQQQDEGDRKQQQQQQQQFNFDQENDATFRILHDILNDLALDEAQVDVALLKTIFSLLGVPDVDEDHVETILQHLSKERKVPNEGSPFVDFWEFLRFVCRSQPNVTKDINIYQLGDFISYTANHL